MQALSRMHVRTCFRNGSAWVIRTYGSGLGMESLRGHRVNLQPLLVNRRRASQIILSRMTVYL